MKYKIKDIARVLNGRAYKQEELLDTGRYRVLRVGNFFTSDKWYYSDLELEKDKYCDAGDLLFAWSANFGPMIWDGEKTIYHYHIWKIEENNEIIDRKFLYYKLQQITEELKRNTHGSVMLHLTKGDMENYKIEVPDIKTQKRIAKILYNIDLKIKLNNQTNDNLLNVA